MSLLKRFAIHFDTNASAASKDVSKLDKEIKGLEKGISKTDVAIKKMADMMRGLSKAQKLDLAKSMGITREQILEINKYDAELKDLSKTKSKLAATNRQVARDSKAATKALAESEKQAEKSKDSFGGLVDSLKGTIAAFVGFEALKSGVIETSKSIAELGQFAKRSGEQVGTLSALENAQKSLGGSTGELSEDIKRLNDMSQDYANNKGGVGLDMFKKFGMSVRDSKGNLKLGSTLLLELADHMSKMTKQESSGIGESLNLSNGTIIMMQKGRHAIEMMENRQKSLGVVTEKQVAAAIKFNAAWSNTKVIFGSLVQQGSSSVVPYLTSLLDGFQNVVLFLKEHKVFAIAFITGVSTALLVTFLPAILASAAAVWAFMAPIIAVAAVCLVLAAAVDDLNSYLKGNSSVIGEIIAKWNSTGSKIKEAIVNAFKEAKAQVSELVTSMTDDMTHRFTSAIQAVTNAFSKMFSWFKDKYATLKGMIPSFMMGDNAAKVGKNVPLANSHITAANQGAVVMTHIDAHNSGSASAAMSGSREIKIGKIEVVTQATDADKIAHGIGSELKRQVAAVQAHYATGVKA